MTIEEFANTTKQLEAFYGKEITDEQKKIWFRELKNMNITRFNYILAQVYRTSKFLPKLADILEINANLGYSPVKQEKSKNKCKKCNGIGYVTYTKVIDNGTGGKLINQYGAICSCRKKSRYEGWKITDEGHRSNYFIPYIEEIGV